MDFLLDADTEIQREVFFSVSDLLNLEVDLILFDTTSTYFETEEESGLRVFGNSEDCRPDRLQVVVGMAVTKEGIPVRCFTFVGNASDQRIIRQVKDELRDWRLHRVIWVADTGFASAENRASYSGPAATTSSAKSCGREPPTRTPSRARAATKPLRTVSRSKEVRVGEGAERCRFVVARNHARVAPRLPAQKEGAGAP